jgi:hypothetical protein
MQGWTRNAVTDASNEELRRLRKEIGRAARAPLRVIVAGDPSKPVLTFTVPRRVAKTLAACAALAGSALLLGGWRHAAPPGASPDFHAALAQATDIPAQLLALSKPRATASAESDSAGPADPAPIEPAASPSRREEIEPRFDIPQPAQRDHFSVEISNTGKMFEVFLGGPAGEPDEESYRLLRHELRCQRTGAETPIDPRLIDLLHQIAVRTRSRIQIVSAFRAPLFPRDLNYHVRGMAADIRVPTLSTAELRDLARSLGATGVGYYPTVQFVHVDVRETPYFWTDTSGHNEAARYDDNDDPAPGADTLSAAPEAAPSLLPSPSSSVTPPSRTPAQSAADALGLRPNAR